MIPVQHIHPMIVHFPIVFIFCLAAFDVLATFSGRSVAGRSVAANISTSLSALAAASAVVAMIFGGMALDFAESSGFHSEIAEMHEGLGETTAIVLSIWAVIRLFFWWRNKSVSGPLAYVFPLVAVLCVCLVTATAFYGGQLVFDLGVNVTKV
jgi:uncharacterized membrane protein